MKLAVFGATGRVGKWVVEQALRDDYEIVALVRTPSKLTIQHPHLTILQGDVLNEADVEKAVEGCDAVISVLGQTKGGAKDMQTVAIRHMIAAMNKYHIRRLISLTGAGVDDPHDQPKLINHLIKTALKLFSGHVLKDAENHADVIRNSGLDWVIVRGPILTDGPFTGSYHVGWVGINTGARLSRANLADFILKQVTDTTYLGKAPMVSD